jgi:glycosyltransferase involved in cell wall biosynthesis
MDSIYENADAFVLPTTSEAFGIAYVEALQKGLPCLGTRIANIPGTVGDAGVLVPPNDIDAITKGIRSLVENYSGYVNRAAMRGETLRSAGDWQSIARYLISSIV